MIQGLRVIETMELMPDTKKDDKYVTGACMEEDLAEPPNVGSDSFQPA